MPIKTKILINLLIGKFFFKLIQNKFNKLKIDRPQLTIISQWPSETFMEMARKKL